jgi:hypothetical protein
MSDIKFNIMQMDGDGQVPIGSASITASEIATDAVESAEIKDGEVKTADIDTDAVTTAKIADANVTNAKLKKPCLRVYQETIAVEDFTDNDDDTGEIDLSTTIPAGAVFARTTIHGISGFAGDTSATIQVGDGSDPDRYNTGTPNVFAEAEEGVDMGVPSGTEFHDTEATPTVTVTTNSDFTSCKSDGGGEATLTLYYYEPV